MLAASPHRGDQRVVRSMGACTIGISDLGRARRSDPRSRRHARRRLRGSARQRRGAGRPVRLGFERSASPADVVLATVQVHRRQGSSPPPRHVRLRRHGRLPALGLPRPRGLETLFYRKEADALYVASEAKQVLRGADVSPEPDLDAVEALFYGELERADASAPSAAFAASWPPRCSPQTSTPLDASPYWDPECAARDARRLSPADAAEQFRDLLAQAVGRMLTGQDVVSLSGGVDSPPIADLRRSRVRPAMGTADSSALGCLPVVSESDESHYIELVAERPRAPAAHVRAGSAAARPVAVLAELFDSPWSTWSPEGTAERCAHAQGARFHDHPERRVRRAGLRAAPVPRHAPALARTLRWAVTPAPLAAGQRASASATSLDELSDAVTPRVVQARRFRRRPTRLSCPPWIDLGRIADATPGSAPGEEPVGERAAARSSAPTRSARLTSTRMRSTASARGGPGPTSTSGSSS